MAELKRYHWPGNVRELENTIERAVVLTTGPSLTPEYGVGDGRGVGARRRACRRCACTRTSSGSSARRSGARSSSARGVKKDAAELMGLSQRALSHYLAKYRID